MNQNYKEADFIISRAGAGSISELSRVGKPLLLIPSPNVSANHHFNNAIALAQNGAALLIEEPNLYQQFDSIFSTLVSQIILFF